MQYINANEYSNQKQIILEHIKQNGNISTVMEHNKRTKKRYARYYLKEGEENELL